VLEAFQWKGQRLAKNSQKDGTASYRSTCNWREAHCQHIACARWLALLLLKTESLGRAYSVTEFFSANQQTLH
jgi:predicted transglutaminase-like protease